MEHPGDNGALRIHIRNLIHSCFSRRTTNFVAVAVMGLVQVLYRNSQQLSTWSPVTEKKAAQLQSLAKALAKRNQTQAVEIEEVGQKGQFWDGVGAKSPMPKESVKSQKLQGAL